MTRRAKYVMLAILLLGLAVGFVYLHVLTRWIKRQGSQHTEEGARTQLRQAALQAVSGATRDITLYFPSNEEGLLLPETRQIAWATNDSDRIRQVLLALIEGSYRGLQRPLPSTTELRATFLTADGSVYVDFSSGALTVFPPGIRSETLAVYSVVNSICGNIPTVKTVRILVQGQEVETLNGHADLSGDFVPDPSLNKPAAPG